MASLTPGRRPLAGRVVLLTGATAGIGRATARALHSRGAVVVGAARTRSRLDELAAELPGVDARSCDVTDRDARSALVDGVLARHGRLDVLVHDAGIGLAGLLHEHTGEELEQLYATNVVAVADLTRLALPHMLERGEGDVLVVSSMAAWMSFPPLTAYASTKFAVDGLVEGLRRETRGRGVRVHSVNPAPIRTEWAARATGGRPSHDGQVKASLGFAPEVVSRQVVHALEARRPRTLAAPRIGGIARAAQLPPVGAVLDLVLPPLAPALSRAGRAFTASRWPDGT